MSKKRLIITGAIAFAAGIAVGGYLFVGSLPRSFLAVSDCAASCYRSSQLAGLLVSAGIQRLPGLVPNLVRETDKCVAIEHPFPEAPLHLVLFPKKDIRNIAEITAEDQAYVMDCFGVIGAWVRDKRIRRYRLFTNGSGLQDIAYLHFHLKSWEGRSAEVSGRPSGTEK